MPPGVLVPSSGGSGSGPIGSGSNWALPETPPIVGPLDFSGVYDFSIYCGDTYTASLQFQISGQPPTLLRLTTTVNDRVDATANDSVSLPQPSTTTNVRSNFDSVQLTWTGYAVQPDTCALTGPGVELTGEVGSTPITLDSSEDQVFSLECQGADGMVHSVSSTLHPVPAVACDVNGDGQIDRLDIALILEALNTPALPDGDPRDADEDGVITVIDARICSTRCTRPGCEQ